MPPKAATPASSSKVPKKTTAAPPQLPLRYLSAEEVILHYKTDESSEWRLLPSPGETSKKFNIKIRFEGRITVTQKAQGNRSLFILEPRQYSVKDAFLRETDETKDTAGHLVGHITCLETPACKLETDQIGQAVDEGISKVSLFTRSLH